MAAQPPLLIVWATALVVLWLAAGRVGEVDNCTLESCLFDGTNGIFFMNWSEFKTASDGDMPFTSDAWSWRRGTWTSFTQWQGAWGDGGGGMRRTHYQHPLPLTKTFTPPPSPPSLFPSGTSS